MIELNEAGFGYGTVPVLRDVTLTLAPGVFQVVTGPPGCGKSTLLQLCHGGLGATTGEVRFFGRPVLQRNRDAVADLRRAIGVIPQQPEFLEHLTVAENIALPLRASGIASVTRSGDLQALLEWVDLDRCGDAFPEHLTRAERQRAALARAVILSPEVILADEPVAGLDKDASEPLLALLVELNRMGKAVLLTTSDAGVVRGVGALAPIRVLHLGGGLVDAVEVGA